MILNRGTGNGRYKTGRTVGKDGYVLVSGQQDHPNHRRGRVAEHVLIMEQILGRYLVEGENVHHKNGIRDDNRPENLELWYVAQPAGQRVEDLIAYLKSTGYRVEREL